MLKEKIKFIIIDFCHNDKNIFCFRTGIKKQLLYSILSNRNKNPGIDVIIKIKATFPEVNLNWLLSDEKIKYRSDYDVLSDYVKWLEKQLEIKDSLIIYLKKVAYQKNK